MIKKWKRRNSRKAQKLYCKIRKRHESFNVQWLLCATPYNVKNLLHFAHVCIYVFRVIIVSISVYFPVQYYPVDLCNEDGLRFLCWLN